MSDEKPPMYFGITDRLNGWDEYGYALDAGRARDSAENMKRYIFEESQFKEENRSLWAEYFKNNPADKTAIFMAGERA